MESLSFKNFDQYLLKHNGRIIHQIWFGTIPNKKDAEKTYMELQKYKNSWIIHNPTWKYTCWSLIRSRQLIRFYYPQHLDMFNNYQYDIQRCDAIRYFILHRYGGIYADMDYYCNQSWDIVIKKYPKDIYLVETPNNIYNKGVYVSNSLMYSSPSHKFWSRLFIELEMNQNLPMYYSRHMTIMFSTGPALLNRVYNKLKVGYKLNFYPFALFHPYGLGADIIKLKAQPEVFAIHLGKGSWESTDSHLLIFFYKEYRIILFIIFIILSPYFLSKFIKKQKPI